MIMKYTIVQNLSKYANALDRLGFYAQANQLDAVAQSLTANAEFTGSELDALMPDTLKPAAKALQEGVGALKDPASAAVRFARALRPKDLDKRLENLKQKVLDNPGYSVALDQIRTMLSEISRLATVDELTATVTNIINRLNVIAKATDLSGWEKDAVHSMLYDIQQAFRTARDSQEFVDTVVEVNEGDNPKLPTTSKYPLLP